MMRVVLASNNPGKLRELEQLLSPLGYDLVCQADLGIPPAPEDGLTFVENALAKARHASLASGLPAIADDSGIVVEALDGAPGIHSARFAGPSATDDDNNRKLLASLEHADTRAAHYYCVIVFLRAAKDPAPLVTCGRWDGRIGTTPRGDNGFGYDPYFELPDLGVTAAELDPESKNQLSHRGQASRSLRDALASLEHAD